MQAKRAVVDAIDAVGVVNADSLLAKLDARSREDFLRLVAAAVNSIKERETPPFVERMNRAAIEVQSSRIDNASDELLRAKGYVNSDPVLAVFCIRRGAEALGKEIYRSLGLEKGGKPARKMTLDELLRPIKDSDIPEVFKCCIEAIQRFGNFASRDQDNQSAYLTTTIAIPLLALYEQSINIQREWLKSRASPVTR